MKKTVLVLALFAAPLAHGEARNIVCTSKKGKNTVEVSYDLKADAQIELNLAVNGIALEAISNQYIFCIDNTTQSECAAGQTVNVTNQLKLPTEFSAFMDGEEVELKVDSSVAGTVPAKLKMNDEKKDVTCVVSVI